MELPTLDDIIAWNREIIEYSGGHQSYAGELFQRESLDHILVAIRYPLFGEDLYPELADKATALVRTIIQGHVFHDGNKRTGMSTLLYFLEMNGYRLNVTDDEIVNVALWIAGRTAHERPDFDAIRSWIDSCMVHDPQTEE